MIAIEEHADNLHVIVCDIKMPKGSEGLELARTVRQQFPTVPILLMSGYTEEPVSEFTLLPKPFTAEQLVEIIDRITGRD